MFGDIANFTLPRAHHTSLNEPVITLDDAKNIVSEMSQLICQLRSEVSGQSSEFDFGKSVMISMIDALDGAEFKTKEIKKIEFGIDQNQLKIMTTSKSEGEVIIASGSDGNGNDGSDPSKYISKSFCQSGTNFMLNYNNTTSSLSVKMMTDSVGADNEKTREIMQRLSKLMGKMLLFASYAMARTGK